MEQLPSLTPPPTTVAAKLASARPPLPSLPVALWRGARNRCPVCEGGPVFAGFLKVVPECRSCGTPLGELRADDAPPYFTIFIVGHLLLPPVFWVEKTYQPPMWVHMAVWLPLFAVVCTLMLRPIKGATVGLMLKLGFGGAEAIPLRNQDHAVTARPGDAAAVQRRADGRSAAEDAVPGQAGAETAEADFIDAKTAGVETAGARDAAAARNTTDGAVAEGSAATEPRHGPGAPPVGTREASREPVPHA